MGLKNLALFIGIIRGDFIEYAKDNFIEYDKDSPNYLNPDFLKK